MRLSESDFAHVEEPRFRRLIHFWLDARGDGDVPPVSAIDPLNFPYVLELVWLCAVEEGPRAFRYRVAGDHIRAAYEGPLVGRTVADITGPSVLDRVMGYFNRAVDGPMVVHVLGRIFTEEEERLARGERLILPFADPATGQITRLLGATVHSWESRGIGPGEVPIRQVRTFTPVDGSPAWCEAWL